MKRHSGFLGIALAMTQACAPEPLPQRSSVLAGCSEGNKDAPVCAANPSGQPNGDASPAPAPAAAAPAAAGAGAPAKLKPEAAAVAPSGDSPPAGRSSSAPAVSSPSFSSVIPVDNLLTAFGKFFNNGNNNSSEGTNGGTAAPPAGPGATDPAPVSEPANPAPAGPTGGSMSLRTTSGTNFKKSATFSPSSETKNVDYCQLAYDTPFTATCVEDYNAEYYRVKGATVCTVLAVGYILKRQVTVNGIVSSYCR